jgi:antitoxin Phd
MENYRTANGNLVSLPEVTASDFKNYPSSVFEQAMNAPVVITKHKKPAGVFLSYAEFEALAKSRKPSLGALENEFDELLASMQTPEAKAAVNALLAASPEELGRAAVRAAQNG